MLDCLHRYLRNVPPEANLPLTETTAVSPLDGRYARTVIELRAVFSEYAFMRARVRVEIEWLLALAALGLPELPALPPAAVASARKLAQGFSLADCESIKAIESRINHDVKAVEYWIKERASSEPELRSAAEFVHFACTSEDINNCAHALMLRDGRAVLVKRLRALHARLRGLAHRHAALPMLGRTHGQAATPTTVGKEFANFAVRLATCIAEVESVLPKAKLNGAVGNFNAHQIACPEVDWERVAACPCVRASIGWAACRCASSRSRACSARRRRTSAARPSCSISACAQLLMSSEVQAKWMNSAALSSSGSSAARSLIQYSTALTS